MQFESLNIKMGGGGLNKNGEGGWPFCLISYNGGYLIKKYFAEKNGKKIKGPPPIIRHGKVVFFIIEHAMIKIKNKKI